MQPPMPLVGRTCEGVRVSARDDQANVEKVLAGDIAASRASCAAGRGRSSTSRTGFAGIAVAPKIWPKRRCYAPIARSKGGGRTRLFRPGYSRWPQTSIVPNFAEYQQEQYR